LPLEHQVKIDQYSFDHNPSDFHSNKLKKKEVKYYFDKNTG
jgi:hypothetical protein